MHVVFPRPEAQQGVGVAGPASPALLVGETESRRKVSLDSISFCFGRWFVLVTFIAPLVLGLASMFQFGGLGLRALW